MCIEIEQQGLSIMSQRAYWGLRVDSEASFTLWDHWCSSLYVLTNLNVKWKNWIIGFCYLCSFLKNNLAFSGNSTPSFKSATSSTSHPVSKSKFQISKSKSWNSKSKWRLNNKLWHWSNKIGQAQWLLSKYLSGNHLLGGWWLFRKSHQL